MGVFAFFGLEFAFDGYYSFTRFYSARTRYRAVYAGFSDLSCGLAIGHNTPHTVSRIIALELPNHMLCRWRPPLHPAPKVPDPRPHNGNVHNLLLFKLMVSVQHSENAGTLPVQSTPSSCVAFASLGVGCWWPETV